MPNKNDWRCKLHSGDEVTWNDPDGGICTRSGTISTVDYYSEGAVRLVMTDGWSVEALITELS